MRTIPADQITVIAAANKIVFSGPNVEGYVVPGNPAADLCRGQADRCAVAAGFRGQ